MLGVNKVTLLGYLGQDPAIRYFEHNKVRAIFSVATHENYLDTDGHPATFTTWHQVVLWGEMAKTAEKQLKQGDPIYIEGKLATRTYTDKSGQKQKSTEVVGLYIVLIGHYTKSAC